MRIKQIISLPIAICAFISTFYSVGKFMMHVSTPIKVQKEWSWIVNLLDNYSLFETTFDPIALDLFYVSCFMLQHSLMASKRWKKLIAAIGLDVAERSIYSLASSYALLYLVTNWQTIPTIALWQIDVSNSRILWWIFVLVHSMAWTVIYGGSIIMDLPEIIGIKQVYYDIRNFRSPSLYQSQDLKDYYEHVRHPSFIGFLMILWIINIMTLDRLILALILSIYMYIAWSTTEKDVTYHKYQLKRKKLELSR